MAANRTTQSIEVPVELALQQALGQAESLKQTLKESVKPDSSAYREIIGMLEKAVRQADMFRQTMQSSLKTTSGTKSFTTNLQKTFDLLGAATTKLQNLSGKDLLFSEADAQRIEAIQNEIKAINTQITELKSNKINGFFNDNTVQEFKDIQALAKKLNLDLNTMTFGDLQKAISKELTKVNENIDKSTEKIRTLETVINNLNLNNVNKLSEGLKQAASSSVVKVLDKNGADAATKNLRKLYADNDLARDNRKTVKANENVTNIIEDETKNLNEALEQRFEGIKSRKERIQNALNDLMKVQPGQPGKMSVKTETVNKYSDLLKELDPDFATLQNNENVYSYARRMREALKNALVQATQDVDNIPEVQASVLKSLSNIFEGLDTKAVINTSSFKHAINEWLSAEGVDVKNNTITQALEGIKANSDVSDILNRISQAVHQYLTQAAQDYQNTAAAQQEYIAEGQNLENAQNTVGESIEFLQKRLQEVEEELKQVKGQYADFINQKRDAFQNKVSSDPSIQKAKQGYEEANRALKEYVNGLSNLESKQRTLGNIQNAIINWMGFNQVLNLTRTAINSMKNHIKELDEVITQIAVVTNMTQKDLWGQVGAYSEIARQYGVAIKGVYQVSQIFYQQGLATNDVMSLTTETLKMARIAGIDYATAADYMTTAVRGFKLEMSEANHVTDVWSALAAKTASDTEELATAISKTASSAEAVGSSFEATSAMIATMVSVTRESATNIGTALKSVISRYGEMTGDPSKLVDSEGQEMSLNRVDKALKTIGITIQDVNGQFRDFDDVILELAEKWDTLDSLSQRYIATLMAGNRQQSRFLSLVGNVKEYKNALSIAMNAEDASELQTLKTMDSLETKIERMKVTIQEFYTSSGLEDLYKNILDIITNVVSALNNMPKLFGNIPVIAITVGMQVIASVKSILQLIVTYFTKTFSDIKLKLVQNIQDPKLTNDYHKAGYEHGKAYQEGFEEGRKGAEESLKSLETDDEPKKTGFLNSSKAAAVSMVANIIGSALSVAGTSMYGASTNSNTDRTAGLLTTAGGVASGVGGAITGAKIGSVFGPGGIAIGGIIGALISGLPGVIAGIDQLNVSIERELELHNKRIEAAHQEAVLRKGEANDLATSLDKLKQLEEAQYTSNEAMEEYINYRNQLAEQFPELVSGYDGEYNAIINLADGYDTLADKIRAAIDAEEKEKKEQVEKAKTSHRYAEAYTNTMGNPVPLYYKSLFGVQRTNDTLPLSLNSVLNSETMLTSVKAWTYEKAMENAGAFSGIYENFGASSVKKLLEAANTDTEYKEALDALIELDNRIRESGEEYTKLLEQEATISNHQTNALQAIYDQLDSQTLYQAFTDKIFQGLINNAVESLDSKHIISIDDNGNQIVTLLDDIPASFDEFFGNLGEEYYKEYNSLAKKQQQELNTILGSRDKYSSADEYKQAVAEYLDINDENIKVLIDGQIEAYTENVKNSRQSLRRFVNKNIGTFESFTDLQAVNGLFYGDDNLSTAYIDSLKSDLTQIKEFIDNGMISYGEKLYNALFSYATKVGELGSEEQIYLETELSKIDRFDKDAVNKLVKQLSKDERFKDSDALNALQEYADTLQASLNTMVSNYVSGISGAQAKLKKLSQATTKGFDEIKDMQEIFNLLESLDLDLDWSTAFEQFNGTWVLTAEAYAQANQALWDKLNENKTDIQTTLKNYKDFAVVISSLVDSSTKNLGGQAEYGDLSSNWAKQLGITEEDPMYLEIERGIASNAINITDGYEAFITSLNKWVEESTKGLQEEFTAAEKIAQSIYVNQAASQIDVIAFLQSNRSGKAREDLQHSIDNYKAAIVETGGEIQSAIDDNFIDIISQGGIDAVKAVQAFNSAHGLGELSSADIETIYRAQTSKLMEAFDQLVYEPGSIIDATAAEIMQEIDVSSVELIEGGQYVVKSAINLAEAYAHLYIKLSNTGEATLSDLNKVYASYLENSGNERAIVEALSDAADMTYTRFGEILAAQGKQLIDYVTKNYVQEIGGGKIRITDFAAFAADMGWSSNSEEYISAFKTYNDSLISMNHQAERNILEEAQNVAAAKGGDKVNLTQLYTAMGSFAEVLANELVQFGGTLENGILTLDENANMIEITQRIASYAETYGNLLASEIAELGDTVADTLNSFIEAISKGLKGGLTNYDANALKNTAASYGVEIDFTKTAEGLKLSKQSAIDLYYALREVDSLKAELLFDDIYDSITEAGSGLENISQTTAEIVKLEKEINEAEGDTSGLEERLALLKQIQLAQANNADSYSFMDRKLPEYLQGPENYWNAVGKAFTSMNNAASSGYMEIDDFYNLVNEMTNLANISGNELEFMGQKISGSAEDAAKLINWGFEALSNVDGKGVKISLEKLGANVFTGAEDMGKGFDDAVKEMARSQIKMLDAQIAMLEAVVAMEQLGDIDINKSGKIDYSEIFDTEGNFTELYKNTAKALAENEKLAPILEQVTVSGHTLKELFGLSADELEKLNINKERWVQIVNALYQMNIGDNWDLENIPKSLREQLAALGQGLTVFNEETKTGWLIDFSGRNFDIKWDSEKEQDRLVKAFKDAGIETTFEKAKETLLKGGETGEFSSSQERLAYEIYFGNVDVTIDDSGNKTYHVKGDSNTYDNENSALNALVGLEQQTRGATLKTVNEDGSRTYSLAAGFTYTTSVTATGKTVYTAEGIDGEFNSYNELTNAVLEQALPKGTNLSNATEEQLTEAGREAKLLVTPHIEFTETPSELTAEQKSQLLSLAGKTAEEIQTWLSTKGEDGKTNAVKLGLKLNVDPENGNLTKDEFLSILESVGIETKYLNIVANITVGENTTGIQFSEEGITATVDELKVTAEKSSYNGDFSITEPIENGTAVVNNLSVGATNVTASGALASLQTLNFASTSQSLLALNTVSSSIGKTSFSNFDKLADVMGTIAEEAETIWNYVQQFADKTFTVEMKQTGEGGESITVNVDSVNAAATNLGTICSTMINNLDGVTNSLEDFSDSVASMSDVLSKLESLSKILSTLNGQSNAIESLSSMVSKIDNVCRALGNIGRKLDNIPSGVKPLSVKFNYSVSKSNAKGNVALAKGDLEAKAAGTPTLMGELGAELVVSKGRYFLVGQDGAEFVNLDKDAIVFNHLQTQRLLGNGHISSRGIPFTNERNAISLAKGRLNGPAAAKPPTLQDYIQKTKDKQKEMGISSNSNNTPGSVLTNAYNQVKDAVTSIFSEKISNVRVSPTSATLPLISYAKGNVHGGPAQASASQALAALKEIRAMWQSMLNASAKDLGQQAGRGGGGKKGGGGGKDWQQKTTTAEIQRWYNLLRQIASLEKDITYEETLQSKLESDRVANGRAMYKSYRAELDYLEKEIAANKELAALQKSWYDNKRAELAASDYGKIFTYDENGLQQYVGSGAPGSGLGLDILENLTRTDIYGQAMDNAATAERQLAYLRSVGFNTDNLRFNEDGTQIVLEGLSGEELDNALVQMMENFWDKVDGWRDELDGIYDSYRDQLNNVLSNEEKRNQILQKIVDNQLSVESDVLKAIESREQKRIDDAKKERDALKDTIDKTINGLGDQLNRERELFNNNKSNNDLDKLRRQLAILQRTGGSSTQIRSLQEQIQNQSQEAYFKAQQEQIDAFKQATDEQIERLDEQLKIMEETLEYQKANGLLWKEVYDIMNKTPEQIQDFIINNTPDFQSNSALQVAEDVRELKMKIEQWIEYREDEKNGNSPMTNIDTWDAYFNSIKMLYNNVGTQDYEKARNIYNATLKETGDPNKAAKAAEDSIKNYQKQAAAGVVSSENIGGGITNGTATISSADKVSTISGQLQEGSKGDDVKKLQKALNVLGYTDRDNNKLDEDGIFGSKTKQALKKFQDAMGISSDGILGPDTKAKFAIKGYKQGGLAYNTGLAMLHGTKSRPELILNSKSTELIHDMFTNKNSTLTQLIDDYHNSINNTTTNFGANTTTVAERGMTIDKLELNLNVDSIANDYDASRAAEMVANKLMDIARKSGSRSVNRR